MDAGCPSRIRTSVHGSKVRCPTTRRRGSGPRKEEWSGRRDSNPRPSPWQGDALPTEPLPLDVRPPSKGGAEGQDRTGDTAIFSRVLYRLSYLGSMVNLAGCPSAERRIPRAFRRVPRGRPSLEPAERCPSASLEPNSDPSLGKTCVRGQVWQLDLVRPGIRPDSGRNSAPRARSATRRRGIGHNGPPAQDLPCVARSGRPKRGAGEPSPSPTPARRAAPLQPLPAADRR